jgi:hypothetical protein
MASCVQCSSRIPEGQRTCSMCYGDPDHGRDGYYREWQEEEQQRQDQRAEEEARQEEDR